MTLFSAVPGVEDGAVEGLLAEQAALSAVERFSQRHDRDSGHKQAPYYRDLIPLTRPSVGEQYAFEVDLDACTGCKACVAACHSLNGLDEGESWRSVTVRRGGTRENALQPALQTVTSACHHCVDPACLSGCPVDAYEKDPITGVVAHLDDQCIGCSYCTLTCPYEVPVFNKSRGIVRKCDMCQGRLSVGEAPACVQACPNGAIAIRIVSVDAAAARAETGPLVVGMPPSSITVPTTVYRSARPDPVAADAAASLTPARAHTPLAVMLVLTQLAVGAFAVDQTLRFLAPGRSGPPAVFDAMIGLAAGLLALGASTLHLGRPLHAYRAVIGLRHSWLSREVVAFGGFTALAAPYALLAWRFGADPPTAVVALGLAATATGLLGVVCSVLIYTTTHRPSWRPLPLFSKFGATTVLCGLATVQWAAMVSTVAGRPRTVPGSSVVVLALVGVAKPAAELLLFRHRSRETGDKHRRARLLAGPLRRTTAIRFAAGLTGAAVLEVLVAAGATSWPAVVLATLALGALVAGELAERSLFFTSVGTAQSVPPTPGTPPS